MPRNSYNKCVFINCPIDEAYRPLFRAITFTVIRCDYVPRCALEEDDASELRLAKIFRLIGECRFGINDLSRTQSDRGLPRFNMPLELGIFLGAKYFGGHGQDRKVSLTFERNPHSYERFISDLKGQDIVAHRNDPEFVVRKIRDWLSTNSQRRSLPGGHVLWRDYVKFSKWLPAKCQKVGFRLVDLTFDDYARLAYLWLRDR